MDCYGRQIKFVNEGSPQVSILSQMNPVNNAVINRVYCIPYKHKAPLFNPKTFKNIRKSFFPYTPPTTPDRVIEFSRKNNFIAAKS
jgi:hypothetical protein